MVPEVAEVREGEGRELGGDDEDERDEEEVHAMGDHVVIPKLDVLEIYGLFEVREVGGTGSKRRSVGALLCHGRSRRDVIGSKNMDLRPGY